MNYSLERNIVIDADLASIRTHLVNLEKWHSWSPWSVIEPQHERDFEGQSGEVGSKMSWNGEVIGSGDMTLVEQSEQRLDFRLVFLTPWKSEANASFTLEPQGQAAQATKVTWSMSGSMPFFLFFMIGMIKAMVGLDYDRGLAMLKSVVETGNVDADTKNEGVIDFDGFEYVGLLRTSHMSEMPAFMSSDFASIMRACSSAKFDEPEHVISVYNKVKLSKQVFTYTSAIAGCDLPLIEAEKTGGKTIKGEIKSQKMLEIKHRGSYQYIGNAWAMGHLTLRAKKIKQNGAPFEYYHNSPVDTPENELLTSVYFPIKA